MQKSVVCQIDNNQQTKPCKKSLKHSSLRNKLIDARVKRRETQLSQLYKLQTAYALGRASVRPNEKRGLPRDMDTEERRTREALHKVSPTRPNSL